MESSEVEYWSEMYFSLYAAPKLLQVRTDRDREVKIVLLPLATCLAVRRQFD